MNAASNGFGIIVPMPRCLYSLLGAIVHIDDAGVVRVVGSISDDLHFKSLLTRRGLPGTLDDTTEEQHVRLTAVFVTGSMDVRPLTKEEASTYSLICGIILRIRALVIDNDSAPMSANIKPSCSWLFTRKPGDNGSGNGIVIGPNLRKVCLNVEKDIINQWVKDAPHKATLWSANQRKRLPKLVIVLEEWTSPTWTRISWGKKQNIAQRSAIGLIQTSETQAPTWQFLAMPGDSLISFKIGNSWVFHPSRHV